jgi:hypothetical protein
MKKLYKKYVFYFQVFKFILREKEKIFKLYFEDKYHRDLLGKVTLKVFKPELLNGPDSLYVGDIPVNWEELIDAKIKEKEQ